MLDFAGAAMNWEKGPQVPEWLIGKASAMQAPVYFIQAETDFSIRPSLELSAAMKKANKPYELKVYPPYGKEPADGHGFVDATEIWGPDVFPKMNEWIKNEKPSR